MGTCRNAIILFSDILFMEILFLDHLVEFVEVDEDAVDQAEGAQDEEEG